MGNKPVVFPPRPPDDSKKDIGHGIEYVRKDPAGALGFLRWLGGFIGALLRPREPPK
jgi:hypothetical protein